MLFLLTKDFLVLLLLSFIISLPLAIWGAMQWLGGFAYRMSLNGWLVVCTAVVDGISGYAFNYQFPCSPGSASQSR